MEVLRWFPSCALIVIHKSYQTQNALMPVWMPTNPPGADLDAQSAGRSPNHMDVVSQSSVQKWRITAIKLSQNWSARFILHKVQTLENMCKINLALQR